MSTHFNAIVERQATDMAEERGHLQARVLHLGDGSGHLALELNELGCRVTALVPESPEEEGGVEWIEARVTAWMSTQFARAKPFDIIVISGVLETLPKEYVIDMLLPSVRDRLARGGTVAIATVRLHKKKLTESDHPGYELADLRGAFRNWDPMLEHDVPEAGAEQGRWPVYFIATKPEDD